MSDNIADGPDGLVIAFDGPRGRTQLNLSNELLTGPLEPFINYLQAAKFDFDPFHAEDLREYFIGRRDGNGGALANHEFRGPKTNGAHPLAGGVTRRLTLGDARRALTDTPESDYEPLDDGLQSGGMQFVQDAAREAKEGRLFVVENLSMEVVSARAGDAYAAVETGALRAPFPATFILATLGGVWGSYLLGALDSGFVADQARGYGLKFTVVSPEMEDGRIVWSGIPSTAVDARDRFQIYAVVALSLIADSRSSVTRVAADDRLNRARIKRGKAPIPPYWRIEAGPTVLVPGVAPKPTTAKGGTHASPRPHDRRGHPRNLKSGRTVWVRDCKINALLPHLTRGREFYLVKL